MPDLPHPVFVTPQHPKYVPKLPESSPSQQLEE
jgi:hypothetical protein